MIADGDWVVVRRQPDADSGDIFALNSPHQRSGISATAGELQGLTPRGMLIFFAAGLGLRVDACYLCELTLEQLGCAIAPAGGHER